ncbi:hypothetical protein Tco_1064383 [Tanacetum coccineum]
MLKTGQRERSSAGRDPGHLLSSEISRWRAPRLEEMIRLRDLGANTPMGVPYTEDQIMAMGRDTISINKPRGVYTDTDVDELKDDNKRVRKELAMLRTVVKSDDRMSQLLTQLESQHEFDGGNRSGGGGDDELGADEDAGGDEEI